MSNNMSNNNSLKISKTTQVRVANELIESSRLNADFYLMLVLSAIVVTLGLIVNSAAVVIGGMLITPLLTPILTLALGLVIADKTVIWRSVKIILQSLGIVLGVAIILGFLFPLKSPNKEIYGRLVANIPYLLIAFAAGLAATFAWSKKNMSAMLPGIAVTVSLLPPLSVLGLGIANLSVEMIHGSLLLFLLNLFGIILGSMLIFSLLNFNKAKKEAIQKVKKEIKEEKKIKEQKEAEQIKEEIKKVEQIKKMVDLKKELESKQK